MLSPLTRRPAALLLALTALLAVALLTSCGGSDEEDVQATLDRAFSEPIGSADMSLNVDLQLEGSEQFSEPIRLQVTGPYRSGTEDALPSFDWDVGVSGGGASIGQIPPVGLISTGDNAFVELQGQAYEVGEDVVSQALEQQQAQEGEEGLAALGVDPREWIVDGQNDGDEEVAGVETTHVSGSVDVPRMLADINAAVQRTGDTAGQQAPALTEEQISQADQVVGDPRFDLFAGKDDGKIRRLTANVDFSVPPALSAQSGGPSGGTLSFSVEFANVGGDQEITVPENPRPLSDLAEQLSGLGGLLGEGSVPGADGGSSAPTAPDSGGQGLAPDGAGQLPAPDGGGAPPRDPGGPASPDEERFRQYGECLQEADPQDQADLQKCNELLGSG